MSEGKDRYEERRKQEHDNEMARLRLQNTHYASEAEMRETTTVMLAGLRSFFEGKAGLDVWPHNDGGGFSIKFTPQP